MTITLYRYVSSRVIVVTLFIVVHNSIHFKIQMKPVPFIALFFAWFDKRQMFEFWLMCAQWHTVCHYRAIAYYLVSLSFVFVCTSFERFLCLYANLSNFTRERCVPHKWVQWNNSATVTCTTLTSITVYLDVCFNFIMIC